MNVLFIGLGAMGYHMAGHLAADSSIKLEVWNRSPEKSKRWQQEFEANVANDLTQSAKQADVLITCTGKDEDLSQILLGADGIGQYLKPKAIIIDHTTTSYKLAQTISKSLSNISFLDAPVSGGEDGAKAGMLSVMVGGDEGVLKQVKSIIEAYAKTIVYIGATGSGQLAKMVNQICIAGVLQGLAEGISFAEAEGIDFDKLLSAISGGAAQSWQMDHRAKTMHQRKFDFGFAIKWMIKDLSYCLEQAKLNGTNLPATREVFQKYQKLSDIGCHDLDTSALIIDK